MWYVYLLLCSDDSLYTGISKNPMERFEEHKVGKGGAYTRSHKPVKLVYAESFSSRSLALKREIQIKSWSRTEKINLLGLHF